MDTNIYTTHYNRCEFANLTDIFQYFRQNNNHLKYYICDLVQYNVRFRDCLREEGIEGVIRMIDRETQRKEPFEEEKESLRKWWTQTMGEHIADYDIQCLPLDKPFTILGSTFDSFADMVHQVEMLANDSISEDRFIPSAIKDYKQNGMGLHVVELYQFFPVFDISDLGDNRCYRNFFVRQHPITDDDMHRFYHLDFRVNRCRVHENIPEDLLPVVYRNDEYDYMLIASAKERH